MCLAQVSYSAPVRIQQSSTLKQAARYCLFIINYAAFLLSDISGPTHCKDTIQIIWNKYSQKRSSPVPIFMCLWRFIYSQDQSAYSAAGKYVDRPWEHINVEIGTKDTQFLFWEYINGISVAVRPSRTAIFSLPLTLYSLSIYDRACLNVYASWLQNGWMHEVHM